MEKIEKNSTGSRMLKGYLMATLFYEPSTRTRLSFESAMKRLGGEVLTTENAREFSSAAKGETLEDILKVVLPEEQQQQPAFPLLMHPTQALLDVYTIEREIGRLDASKSDLLEILLMEEQSAHLPICLPSMRMLKSTLCLLMR
ncbi:Aspartate carbamoyltransferase [Forsythia ovata]|uniref:Aspartate carbamoyltransferase n=1 Tax=Forsythia ovata TaxID=205694 RepID=A0ABD1QEA8_9LAMI